MAVNLSINGVVYTFPETADENWGDNVTSWASAVTTGMLQKSGGSFSLTSEVDLGASFSIKATYFKSRTANPASSGFVRLANSDGVKWRNSANNGDLALKVNSDALEFNGNPVVTLALGSADTALRMKADATGYEWSKLVDANIDDSADIAYSKLDLAGSISNSDISASAGIAYTKLNLAEGVVNADISASAAIAYSKLNLATSIVNADISASAAIAYSKLNLAGSIVNADIASGAAIARSKVAAGTAGHVVINDGSGNLSSEAQLAISRGGTGQSTANGALNAFLPSQSGESGKVLGTDGTNTVWVAPLTNPMTTAGDLIVGGSGGAANRLGIGASGTILRSNGSAASWTANSAANVSYSNGTSGLTASQVQAAIDELAAKNKNGVWTPTYTIQANLAATPAGNLRYIITNGMAWIYGKISLNTTAGAGTQTSFDIRMPAAILTNPFADDGRAGGSLTRFNSATNSSIVSATGTTAVSVIFSAPVAGGPNSYWISFHVECN